MAVSELRTPGVIPASKRRVPAVMGRPPSSLVSPPEPLRGETITTKILMGTPGRSSTGQTLSRNQFSRWDLPYNREFGGRPPPRPLSPGERGRFGTPPLRAASIQMTPASLPVFRRYHRHDGRCPDRTSGSEFHLSDIRNQGFNDRGCRANPKRAGRAVQAGTAPPHRRSRRNLTRRRFATK